MSNFVETLEEIYNRFLSNLHSISMLVDALIELDNLIENDTNEINLVLINSFKKKRVKEAT